MNAVWLAAVGFAAGIISGMGIGGGAILIPALTLIFGMTQQNAQHINLLYFIPTALFAVRVHKKNDNIEKKGLFPLIIWGLLGALPGALIAIKINANYLRKGFAIFLLLMAVCEIYKGYQKWQQKKKGEKNDGTDYIRNNENKI